jgi:hypothetical protein
MMAVCSGVSGIIITYDKRKLRPVEPPPPPSIAEQIAAIRAKWPDIMTPIKAVDSVIEATCRHFGMNRVQIMARRRMNKLVYARHICWYLCREMTGASFPEIGRRFGGMDHTSVLHGAQKIGRLIDRGDAQTAIAVDAVRTIARQINPALKVTP